MSTALDMLHRVSWQAEKLFRARGWLRTMVWITETKDSHRQMFETACEVRRAEVSDDQALAALCADLRADFAADGVVRYAVAFPASATITLRPSILHRDSERRRHEVVAIEAHDANTHLRAHRQILVVGGLPRLAALRPIGPATQPRFNVAA